MVLGGERDIGAKLSLALTDRDKASQQQLSKIRKGWKEGREKYFHLKNKEQE